MTESASPAILPIIRRAILDLLNDTGGEHNHDVLAALLRQLGHRVARRDVAAQLLWLAARGYVAADEIGPFTVARILSDGRDISDGQLSDPGISRFRTGE